VILLAEDFKLCPACARGLFSFRMGSSHERESVPQLLQTTDGPARDSVQLIARLENNSMSFSPSSLCIDYTT
jgi:hypothetical protein